MKTISVHQILLFLLLAVLSVVGCKKNDTPAPALREEMIDMGSYRIYARTTGDKSPVMVLITGIAGTTDDWKTMEDDLSEVATVINYDREGLGRSGWQMGAKDSKSIAEELHALLEAKGLQPPYLLVAHSLGGLHARVFTHLYGEEVSGLVLVDPTPEDLLDSLIARLPPDQQDFYREQLRLQEEAINQMPDGAVKSELKAINTCYEQARTLNFSTSAPVAVISSMKLEDGDSDASKILAKSLRDQMLAQVSTGKNKHYTTDTAGHFVQNEQPGLVMEAVRWVLNN